MVTRITGTSSLGTKISKERIWGFTEFFWDVTLPAVERQQIRTLCWCGNHWNNASSTDGASGEISSWCNRVWHCYWRNQPFFNEPGLLVSMLTSRFQWFIVYLKTFMDFLPCHIIIPLLILLFSCCWFVQWLWWKLSEAILVFEFSYFYCWAVKPALLLCSYNRRGCCDFSIQVSVILFATCNIFSCYFLCVYIIFRLFSMCLSCFPWSFPFYFLSECFLFINMDFVLNFCMFYVQAFRRQKPVLSRSYSIKGGACHIFNNCIFLQNVLAEWSGVYEKTRSEDSAIC